MAVAYLSLGTNLGNRMHHLAAAVAQLERAGRVLRRSPIYQTEPWGYTEQPAFLNQVVEIETALTPTDLLNLLKEIEIQLGRQPNFRYGPRAIDLDILLYDQVVVNLPGLQIPHSRLAERPFALVPLADLTAELRHPVLGRTIGELLERTGRAGVSRYEETHAAAPLHAAKRLLPWGSRTFIMGILNVTPDSFSGDGLLSAAETVEAALVQARHFVDTGADILDVGGESTRPGAQAVSVEEELARVLPVVQALAAEELPALISIDTYKAQVAEAALQAGAHWINDVWGLRADSRLAGVAARHQAPVILMHNRSRPSDADLQARLGGRYVGVQYEDLLADVQRELLESVSLAHQAGIPDEHIILDPGIGFGKTVEQNLELINRLDVLKQLGYPLLLGASRKSFIGYTLDLPPDQRLEGTAAAITVGILRGADLVRVHDVTQLARVVKMTDAILGRHSPNAAHRSGQ